MQKEPKLILKFFYVKDGRRQLVISPALFISRGDFSDARYIYTEAGQFHKAFVSGEIFTEWQEDIVKENGQD